MSVTIDFVGMVYFVHEDEVNRRVLFPDGTVRVGNVPKHFTSIFADKSAVRASDWWATPQKDVFVDHGVVEFSIPKAKAAITISGVSDELRGAALDTSRHEPQIPKLRSINQNFVLDRKKPEAIAEMWVRQGTLTACNFGGAVVSQLISGYDGRIRVEAKLKGQTRFIELNNDAEIVLSNTSDLFKPKSKEPVAEDDHFRLYAKLDEKRNFNALSTPPGQLLQSAAQLDPLDFSCIYMALVQQELGLEIPLPECSNGCC